MWHLKSIPKTLHAYWGGNKLSFLRFLTLATFQRYNPDWEIVLYKPIAPQSRFHWVSGEQTYDNNYVDCFDKVEELGITIQEVDFSKIGFFNDASEVHKSDYLRWYLLSTVGGVWSDVDILFIKPMDELCFNKPEVSNINTVVCLGSLEHSIGFLMGSKWNKYFKTLCDASTKDYKKEGYQSMGSLLCGKLFPTMNAINTGNTVAYSLPMDIVYAHDSTKVKEIFEEGCRSRLTNSTIGIHWYGGHWLSGKYMNTTNGGLYSTGHSIMDDYIRKFKAGMELNNSKTKRTISIVMAFYNRQELLNKTLESLDKSSVKDYELIIVDDASAVPLVCPRAKIIRVEKKDKWYNCSCVAWNRGLREATGDIVILNSPECYHAGDILAYAQENLRPNLYLAFGCYAISKKETEDFQRGIMPAIENHIINSGNGWYNHSRYRPVAYHFCSAILRKDLDMIGGFDERYAYGVAFDDDEFIRTIRYMGMDVRIVDSPYVIHQYHTHFEFDSPSVWQAPHALNQALYNTGYDAKVHRDYGRNSDPFDPVKFKESWDAGTLKKKPTEFPMESPQRKSDNSLNSFLRKIAR